MSTDDVVVVDLLERESVVNTDTAIVSVTDSTATSVIVAEAESTSVTMSDDTINVVSVGEQGPDGAQGVPGPAGGQVYVKLAGQNLSGHRIVIANNDLFTYADNTQAAHAKKVVGMTTGAAMLGAFASALRDGPLVEPSWEWIPEEPIYLGVNGLLTQTPPVAPAAFLLTVGFATSPTSMVVSIGIPILISQGA